MRPADHGGAHEGQATVEGHAASTPEDRQAIDAIVARIQQVYAGWRRDTPAARRRADWDALFDGTGPATPQPLEIGGVPCCWMSAPGVRCDQAIVYVHGGGFQVGSLHSHREIMGALSAAAGVRVLGVGYRLAPEHRQPDALADVLQVLDGLEALGIAAANTAMAGDSAGGGLVLAALVARQQRGQPLPAAVLTMSAWTDMTASGTSYDTHADADPIHQRPMMLALARVAMAPGQDAADPLLSPRFTAPAQLRGWPPLLLQVGARETLLSDSLDLADRVNAAGGQAVCQVAPDMIHVFQQFPRELSAARAAITSAGHFVAGHLQRGAMPPLPTGVTA